MAAVVCPVPPEAIAKVADRPAAVPDVFWFNVGNVQLAKLPEDGVPSAGLVRVLFARVCVPLSVTTEESIATVTAAEPL